MWPVHTHTHHHTHAWIPVDHGWVDVYHEGSGVYTVALVDELRARVAECDKEVEKARERYAVAEATLEQAQRDRKHFQGALDAILRREGGKTTPKKVVAKSQIAALPIAPPDDASNKTDIAFAIIKASGADGLETSDLDSALKARGLTFSKNYMFNITSRLKAQGKIDKRGRRYYAK